MSFRMYILIASQYLAIINQLRWMSILQCLCCCSKIYPICCYERSLNYSGICEPCLLKLSFNGREACPNCHQSITHSLFNLKNQIIRNKNSHQLNFIHSSKHKLPPQVITDIHMGNARVMSSLKKSNSYLKQIQSTPLKFNYPSTFNQMTNRQDEYKFGHKQTYQETSAACIDQYQVTDQQIRAANEAMEIPLYTTIQTKLQKEKQKNTTTIYFDSELSKSQQSIWDGFSSHCSESTEYSHY